MTSHDNVTDIVGNARKGWDEVTGYQNPLIRKEAMTEWAIRHGAELLDEAATLRKQLDDARSEALEEAADRSCHHCDPLIRALKGKS